MAGPVAAGGVTFAVAGPADEADIRRLLRDNPLGGRYGISLEREPDAFAGHAGTYILARHHGTAIGLCERVVHPVFLDGQVRLLPYLGALRVAPGHRHRLPVLRGGFAALRGLEQPDDLPFALTAITADNTPARRLLTAGLPGLPLYQPLADYATLALRPRRGRVAADIATATAADLSELAGFLHRLGLGHPFAPVWTEDDLRRLGAENLLISRGADGIRGCLAVWDQRAVRQVVVRRYPPLLGRLRPLANLAAPLLGLPRLPAPGMAIPQAVLSAVAVEKDDPAVLLALVAAALDQAARRGLAAVLFGCAAAHPWRAAVRRRYRALEYRTALFLVHWQEAVAVPAGLPRPDLGLL